MLGNFILAWEKFITHFDWLYMNLTFIVTKDSMEGEE